MRADTWAALGIVLAAVAYLVRRAVRRSRAAKATGPGCDRCAH
jgi:hypothetical protein